MPDTSDRELLELAARALLPCPFCGNPDPVLIEHPAHTHVIATFMPDHHGSWTLECVACNVGMIEDEPGAKDRIIERWNRRAALAEDDGIGWQPIETAPTTGLKVILAYVNRNGKPRTVMGRWLTDEEAAEIDADDVGLEGGWYECIDNWDDYTEVAIHEGKPTHWMPLPAPPAAAEKETK